jgi:DNA-binding response OmpR family regulator
MEQTPCAGRENVRRTFSDGCHNAYHEWVVSRAHHQRGDAPCRVIIVSQHESQAFMKEALRAGASGYKTKSNAAAQLVAEIRRVQERHIPSPNEHGEGPAE